MKRVLILGGGFGGIAAARRLRQKLDPSDEVILVDRRQHFMVGFRKTWALVGESTLEAGQRPLAHLAALGIRVIHDSVTLINPEGREAAVGDAPIGADALVVALGAELAPDLIPGLPEFGFNVYDPEDIPRAAVALSEVRGGRVVIGIFGAPYKCPPAPYEMALLVNDSLGKRGAQASVDVFTPQPMSLPVLGPARSALIERRLAVNGITFLANHKATGVEAGEVLFGETRRPFELLLGIPPHRPPEVVRESGLVDNSGWIPVNPATLETQFPGVYAIGDVVQIPMANGKALPKAGIFAEAMGETVADRIIAGFNGQAPEATFEGQGTCYFEVGAGQGMMVTGHFLAEPEPEVMLSEASPKFLDEKRMFETQRLERWFA